MEEARKREYFGDSHDPDLMEYAVERTVELLSGKGTPEEGGNLPEVPEGEHPQVVIDIDEIFHIVNAEEEVLQTEESKFARQGIGYRKPHNVSADPVTLQLLPGGSDHEPGETVSKCLMIYRDEDYEEFVESLGDELESRFPTEVELMDEPIDEERFSYLERSTEVYRSMGEFLTPD
ncbi:MAG: hypothetical protein ABEJ03_03765 [Candidatus Nanohaloarchaea archaeon]